MINKFSRIGVGRMSKHVSTLHENFFQVKVGINGKKSRCWSSMLSSIDFPFTLRDECMEFFRRKKANENCNKKQFRLIGKKILILVVVCTFW